jgi:hypothetical protein
MKLAITCLLCFLSSIVHADCSDESNNLIQDANCGFDTDTMFWDYGADLVEHDTDDYLNQGVGHGSVLLHSYRFDPTSYTDMNQCVTITTDSVAKTIGGWVKQKLGATNGQCRISASFYDQASCNGVDNTCFGTYQEINLTDWTHLSCESEALLFDPLSVSVWIDCNSAIDFSTNYDNLYIVPTGDSLFKNGFDSI